MLRKLLFRLFLIAFILTGTVVATVCVAGYLALQQPGFYAELRAQEFAPAEQKTSELAFRAMEQDFKRWVEGSLRQQAQQANPMAANPLALVGLQPKYDPTQDTHTVRVTAQQLNAQLASTSRRGDWRNPRVRIAKDRVGVAFEVATPELSCVVAGELKPTITDDGRLRLDLLSARIGQLPLPLNTILGCLPRDIVLEDDEVELNLAPPSPHMSFKLANQREQTPRVKSIQCTEGQIAVEFAAPILKAEQNKRDPAPLALSDVN